MSPIDIIGPLIIITLIAIFILDTLFFYRRTRIWRAIYYFISTFITLSIGFGVTELFGNETSGFTFRGFVVLNLIISILVVIANFLNWLWVDNKARNLREKYSKLPDGPQKQGVLRMLNKIERIQNRGKIREDKGDYPDN